jgi:hypothetical protein
MIMLESVFFITSCVFFFFLAKQLQHPSSKPHTPREGGSQYYKK